MGTGATIVNGGTKTKRLSKSISASDSYYNKNQNPYSYGVVRIVNSDRSIQYESIEDNIGSNKTGYAIPYDKSVVNVNVGEIVPLFKGPSDSVGLLSNQYDKVIYYLNSITNKGNPDDNSNVRQTDGDPNENFRANYLGFKDQKVSSSATIENVYKPALEKTFPNFSKGIKLLMQAQVQLEGFSPTTVAYKSNNPGNVGTETSVKPPRIKTFSTLEEGIKAQWNQVLKGALNNTSSNYTSNMTLYNYLYKYAPPYNNQGNLTGNNPTTYTNFIISYFKKNGIDITANTTLEQISKIA